jgi:ribosome-associated protein
MDTAPKRSTVKRDDRLSGPGFSIPMSEIAFSADPSGGKGGQHANRSSTRVELRFSVRDSAALSARQKALLAAKLGPRLTAEGVLRVVSARERSQLQNRRAALARLADLLARGLARPKARTATKPTLSSRRERVDAKKRRARVKAERRAPDPE